MGLTVYVVLNGLQTFSLMFVIPAKFKLFPLQLFFSVEGSPGLSNPAPLSHYYYYNIMCTMIVFHILS